MTPASSPEPTRGSTRQRTWRLLCPRRRSDGFTLIEVLVALAIVAFGMAALLSSITSSADTTIFLRDKTLAQWIALNQLAAVRLKGTLPGKGKTEGEVEEFAGRRWHWQQEVKPLEVEGMLRIDVSVRPADIPEANKASWYATESGVMGDAVNYNWYDAADWDRSAPASPQQPQQALQPLQPQQPQEPRP